MVHHRFNFVRLPMQIVHLCKMLSIKYHISNSHELQLDKETNNSEHKSIK